MGSGRKEGRDLDKGSAGGKKGKPGGSDGGVIPGSQRVRREGETAAGMDETFEWVGRDISSPLHHSQSNPKPSLNKFHLGCKSIHL